MLVHSVTSLLFIGGLGFLKHLRSGGSRFSLELEGLSVEGGKYCFSLIMYGFCGSIFLYPVSLAFRMIIFLLTPFDT